MAVLLDIRGASWGAISRCLHSIAGPCRQHAHFIYLSGEISADLQHEFDFLVRYLGLEDHLEPIDPTFATALPDAIRLSATHPDPVAIGRIAASHVVATQGKIGSSMAA